MAAWRHSTTTEHVAQRSTRPGADTIAGSGSGALTVLEWLFASATDTTSHLDACTSPDLNHDVVGTLVAVDDATERPHDQRLWRGQSVNNSLTD
jgi:hypothetical protein